LTLTDELNTYTELLDNKLDGRFSPLLDRGATDQELDQLQHNWQRTLTPTVREFYRWARGPKQPATQAFPVGDFYPVFTTRPLPDLLPSFVAAVADRTGNPTPQQPWPLLDFTERTVLVDLEGPDKDSVWYLNLESRHGCFKAADNLETFVQRMRKIAETSLRGMLSDGGDGNDTLEGENGHDTCTNGETIKTCEITPPTSPPPPTPPDRPS
jgi:hypothetical protein